MPPSETLRRTSRYLATTRYAILSASLLAALFLHRHQAEIAPVPQSAVVSEDVVARYIGPMDAVRRKNDKDFTRRDAGVGLEYSPGEESEDSSLPTVRRAVFSQQLSLTEDDVKLIRARGPRYTIGVANDQIITIAGAGGTPITYSQYVQRTSNLQRQWFYSSVLVAVAGGALFLLGHWQSVRHRADA